MGFKEQIKRLRELNRLTKKDLAEDLKISPGLIYQWEKGMCSPDTDRLIDIADYFGITPNELLGYDIPKKKDDKELEVKIKLNEEQIKEISDYYFEGFGTKIESKKKNESKE